MTGRRLRRLFLGALGATVITLPLASAGEPQPTDPVRRGDDVGVPIAHVESSLEPQAADPLALLVGIDTLRDHSLGSDRLDVWSCGVSESPQTLATQLESQLGPYFEFHSRGRYDPVFVPKGTAGADDCDTYSLANASPYANGAIHVTPGAGGFASPGWTCGFVPCPWSEYYSQGNQRMAFVGNEMVFYSTAAHEMGHMIAWPHSYTGVMPETDYYREYDDALDVMSGNYGAFSGGYGNYPDPYATSAINKYAAGWIDTGEVYVFTGDGASLDLVTGANNGRRMAVIRASGRFYALGARIPSPYDPIPDHWAGVEVYEIETCGTESACLNRDDMQPGFRRIRPHPAVPFDFYDPASYEEPLAHVIPPGSARTVAGVRVAVGAMSGGSISVAIGPSPSPLPDPSTGSSFADTSGNVFAEDIEWLAASGITRGCNPPANDRFCPEDPVTRGQMAAFLHRALPDLVTGTATEFRDDNGHVFESDIEWLSATGVTRGCNPPANDRFCPDEIITRAQMAAFLHRALPGLAAGPITDFRDDDGNVFESDIEWLAGTGVTRGCNPPANDRFCPGSPVTRGAMAAFLHRALGG